MIYVLLAIVGSYLLGAVPVGYLVGKIASGKDVREDGSGATGATNVARQFGIGFALLTGLLDATKGAVPALVAAKFGPDWLPAAAAIAAIIGHIYPIYLGFKGGKGICTALGAALIISPWGVALGAVGFVGAFAVSRFVSAGSLTAVIVYSSAVLGFGERISAGGIAPRIFAILLPIIVFWSHRENIRRLIKGEELKPNKESK